MELRALGARGLLGITDFILDEWGVWVDQNRDRLGFRHEFTKQLDPLGAQPMQADAGQVAARASNTGNETVLYRVDADKADNRDYRGRLFGREGRALAAFSYDDIDIARDEFGRQAGQPVVIGGCPAIFDRNVPALNI